MNLNPFGKLTKATLADIQDIPELCVDNEFRPPKDLRYDALLERALGGEPIVHYAVVPLGLCVPGDLDFRLDVTDNGKRMLEAVYQDAMQGQPPVLWVYQRGWWFVVSDDYPQLFAATRGMPDYVPCWVLGKPDHPLVEKVQGPMDPVEIRKMLLGSV